METTGRRRRTLLASAELELFDQSRDAARLRRVYPPLKRNFDYLAGYLRRDDGLCSTTSTPPAPR
jgi:hypothetical protein